MKNIEKSKFVSFSEKELLKMECLIEKDKIDTLQKFLQLKKR